jgi:hypothetical protein
MREVERQLPSHKPAPVKKQQFPINETTGFGVNDRCEDTYMVSSLGTGMSGDITEAGA